MTSRTAAGLMLLLAALVPPPAPAAGATEASAGGSNIAAVYDFYFAGLRAAKLTISAEFEAGGGYQASGHFKTLGVVDLFSDTDMRSETVGKLGADGPEPLRYHSRTGKGDDGRQVEIAFSDSGPAAVSASPAFKQRPWSIEPSDQHGVTDPLSAVLSALRPGPVEAICGRRIEAFDGRHRFAFEIGEPRPDGDRIRCKSAFVRVAGYKPKKMKKDPRRPFMLYLAERPSGQFQVVELTVPTDFGEAVMLLRE